jgi:hypothetical protein
MVGARGFEPPTTATPLRCATRLRYAPIKPTPGSRRRSSQGKVGNHTRVQLPDKYDRRSLSALEKPKYGLQIVDEGLNYLLLVHLTINSVFRCQLVASTTNGKTIDVEQFANLTDQNDVVTLIIAPVSATLDRF